jgi:hypothetical protein
MDLVEISWFWTDWAVEAENSVTVRRRRRRIFEATIDQMIKMTI